MYIHLTVTVKLWLESCKFVSFNIASLNSNSENYSEKIYILMCVDSEMSS